MDVVLLAQKIHTENKTTEFTLLDSVVKSEGHLIKYHNFKNLFDLHIKQPDGNLQNFDLKNGVTISIKLEDRPIIKVKDILFIISLNPLVFKGENLTVSRII